MYHMCLCLDSIRDGGWQSKSIVSTIKRKVIDVKYKRSNESVQLMLSHILPNKYIKKHGIAQNEIKIGFAQFTLHKCPSVCLVCVYRLAVNVKMFMMLQRKVMCSCLYTEFCECLVHGIKIKDFHFFFESLSLLVVAATRALLSPRKLRKQNEIGSGPEFAQY